MDAWDRFWVVCAGTAVCLAALGLALALRSAWQEIREMWRMRRNRYE